MMGNYQVYNSQPMRLQTPLRNTPVSNIVTMKDRASRMTMLEPDQNNEDKEALLPESEKDILPRSNRSSKFLMVVAFAITACVALISGVLLERHVFVDKNFVCATHLFKSSKRFLTQKAN
jgi:hypothetical protein